MQDGTGSTLTVDSAASRFEGLLSDESEHTEPTRETPPVATPPAPESVPADAAADADPETDAPDESDAEPAEDVTDDETPSDPEPPTVHTVKIDGKDVPVTLDELKKGYSRTSDYTRKTQALAEERKAIDAVKAERQEVATKLKALETAIEQYQPQEPDWDTLQRENPAEFATVWAQWQRYTQHLATVKTERERAEQQVAKDQSEAARQYVDAERAKLVEAIPAWKDAAVQKAETADLLAYATSSGYSEDEVRQVMDHRPLVLLRKAMLYDKAQQAKPAVRQRIEAVKVATPGPAAGAKRPPVSDTTKAKQRLAKTGRLEDGAAVMLHMLDDD